MSQPAHTRWTAEERKNPAGVCAVDMDRMTIYLDSGERCPITNMIDADREETSDPDDAEVLVFEIKSSGKFGVCER